MKKGDVLQIDGRFGFLWSPKMKVLEVKGQMVLLEPLDAKKGGVLSGLNQTWHSIKLVDKKLKQSI